MKIRSFLRIRDILRLSARQVLRQHKRYMGVFVSIAIGTAGVIIILSMGQEVKKTLNEDLEVLGGGTIIKAFFEIGLSEQDLLQRPQWYQERTVEALREIPGVRSVSRLGRGYGSTTWQNKSVRFSIFGVEADYWDIDGDTPAQGRFFNQEDVNDRRQVCVLTQGLVDRLLGPEEEVIGLFVPLNSSLYQVVGVIGGANPRAMDNAAFIPLTTWEDRFQGKSSRAYLRCATWDDVERVAAAVPLVIAEYQSDDGLKVEVAWDQLERLRNIVWWVELFIIIAVIGTFLLGGFGIWSGMMSAVKSRTREIGLKKAMGAEDADVMIQFLAEAMCLSLAAALLGICFGRVGIEVISYLLESRPPESLFFMCSGLSLVFTLFLGITAGFYPSLRAARMDVVSAIKYE